MRFTVVDSDGTVSFVGPCHGLKVLAAACSRGAEDHRSLLHLAKDYDRRLAGDVLNGLTIFDEHNTRQNTQAIHARLDAGDRRHEPPFRVLDDTTRARSLEPARAGLVVFNLKERRIVQVQNSYADLQRQGRGRIRSDGKPTRTLFHYKLPATWRIVP